MYSLCAIPKDRQFFKHNSGSENSGEALPIWLISTASIKPADLSLNTAIDGEDENGPIKFEGISGGE
jgi:hypothetical protein